ncbi:MAG TPA: FkbM family methyltransferase [Polyangia bacterium]|nr:FkbM family methyltransferase [Polyangia bacterium]
MNDGTTMTVPRSAEMSWIPAFTGAYDPAQLEIILRFLTPGSFALDVGACFGFYAVPMGRAAAKKDAQVLAFEALRSNERLLRNNLHQNRLDGVVVSLPIALGREPATVEMLVEGGGTGNAFVRTSGFKGAADSRAVAENIRIERLDDMPWYRWTSKARCSLVKMDIEGFELEALAGGEAFIAKHRPVIFGEFNGWFLERHGFSPDAPIEWARRHGYVCLDLVSARRSRLTDEVRLTPQALGAGAARRGGDLLLLPIENPSLVDRLLPNRLSRIAQPQSAASSPAQPPPATTTVSAGAPETGTGRRAP